MKKLLVPSLLVLLLACNANNGGGNESNSAAGRPADSTQIPNRGDSTPTSNNNAYNTTDTGLSRGSTTDSSGKHTMTNGSVGAQHKNPKK